MVEFKTIKSEEIRYGKNNFLEIARKTTKTEEGETEIISIGKGFFNQEDQKRFKNALGFAFNVETIDKIIKALENMKI